MNEVFGMNELSPAQRERVLERLREGRSLRAIETETGHRRETIGRYGREAGLLAPLRQRATSERSAPSSRLRICWPTRGAIRAPRRVEPGRCEPA